MTDLTKPSSALIFTPANGGLVHGPFALALGVTMVELGRRGWTFTPFIANLCSSLPKIRNQAAASLLNGTWEWLVFLDADMMWSDSAALDRMMTSGHDLVCGVYPSRGEKPFWTFRPKAGAQVDADGFLELETGPTGFLAVHRGVFQRIATKRPDLKINLERREGVEPNTYFFFREQRDKTGVSMMSDDYGFFETALECGERLFCYTDLTFRHYWTTYNEGNVADAIKAGEVTL